LPFPRDYTFLLRFEVRVEERQDAAPGILRRSFVEADSDNLQHVEDCGPVVIQERMACLGIVLYVMCHSGRR
jgi:hypothetical protein